MDISLIIVNFNTRDLLKDCLSSVVHSMEESHLSGEIIVVDNDSSDGSASMVEKQFPQVLLIKNMTNQGFARANNKGIKQAHGKYILLLNSDTILFKDTLKNMFDFMEKHKDAGVATCRVELANGNLDPACHRGFPTPWVSFTYFSGLEKLFSGSKLFAGYHQTYKDFSKPHEIDSCSGAFYLLRKEVVDDVGLLDEEYFMYGEDLDWSYRIKQKGWKIFYNPDTKIIHFKKRSGRYHPNKTIKNKTTEYFYSTMKLFYKKHFEKKYPWIVTKFVYLVIQLKKLIS